MATLTIQMPGLGEVVHELTGDRITIGREPDNTIQIADASVSPYHAELLPADGYYRLHDLDSVHLSFVNGVPVTDFHLRAGCRISFGTVECDFDPHAGPVPPSGEHLTEMRDELTSLNAENADLLGKLHVLQRRLDVVSSARFVTTRTEMAPFAAATDALRAVTSERDDLRLQNTVLQRELESVRAELSHLRQQCDAAREIVAGLQIAKTALGRRLREHEQPSIAAEIAFDGGEIPERRTAFGGA